MIDVHCLRHNNENIFFPLLLKQLKKEDINLFVVENGSNIGAGRVRGFLSGTSEYVSYVDYDDLIVPGIFKKIEKVMSTGIPWCYTDEVLIDSFGECIQPGWSSNPELYGPKLLEFVKIKPGEHCHHILTFRRELFTDRLVYIMKQLRELPEEYLRVELAQYEHTHIPEIGYFWRQHENNTVNKYECYKDYERERND